MAQDIGDGAASRLAEENEMTDGPLVGAARTVESAARRMRERALESRERIAKKTVEEIFSDGREFVRENPGKTILVAAGVGALVGYLVGRRRS